MAAATVGQRNDLSGRVAMWLARAGCAALTAMMAITFCDVVGRYVFSTPIVGTVEVTELLMGMMIYLGIGLTTYMRGHIRVDILILRMPQRLRALCDLITLSIGAAFAILICWQLWLRAGISFDKGDLTQVWEWPVWPAAYVMAASSILLATSLLLQVGQAARALVGGGDGPPAIPG